MNNCKTCKHWYTFGDQQRGTCEVSTSVFSGGYTLVVDVDYDAEPAEARLKTHADFGCTLWEEEK